MTQVNSSNGVLTLNRGYRGTTGTGISVFKGTVNEIPVGYVAFDVQKISTMLLEIIVHGHLVDHSIQIKDSTVVFNGQTYYTVAGQVQHHGATAPTHTSGSALMVISLYGLMHLIQDYTYMDIHLKQLNLHINYKVSILVLRNKIRYMFH